MSQMDREEYEERTRPKLTGGSSPTAKNTLRVILLSMAVPIILSATGPLYYGYTDGPYWRVIVWALACTVGFSWLERSSFKPRKTHNARTEEHTSEPQSHLNLVCRLLLA